MKSGYHQALHARFKDAWNASDGQAVTLEIDETILRFMLAGEPMAAAVVPALLPHVRASDHDPAFTIELWDSDSIAIRPPTPPWGPEDGGPLGAVRGHNDELSKTVVDHASGTITACDLSDGLAVFWAASAAALPGWWRAGPLRLLLGWILARPGRHMVHAGAVGVDGRGVLIAGSGGAGKSTLAVTCLEAGMEYVGDDYVLLSTGNPPRAHALYGTAKLDRRSLARLPALESGAMFNGEAKAVIDLATLRPSRLRRSLSVEAIVIPRLSDARRSELRPISAAVPFRDMAVSTIFQAPDGGATAMQVIGQVVRSVPAYELDLGRDVSRAPELVRALLAGSAEQRKSGTGHQ